MSWTVILNLLSNRGFDDERFMIAMNYYYTYILIYFIYKNLLNVYIVPIYQLSIILDIFGSVLYGQFQYLRYKWKKQKTKIK